MTVALASRISFAATALFAMLTSWQAMLALPLA